MSSALKNAISSINHLGFWAGVLVSFNRIKIPGLNRLKVKIKNIEHPFTFERDSSDCFVIKQILQEEEYRDCLPYAINGWVLDCGANIGCTSVFFLNRCPNIRVLAIEPEERNFSILSKNLSYYGERAICIKAGIASSDQMLQRSTKQFRDGSHWSFSVEPAMEHSEDNIQGISISQLLTEFSINKLDVVKIDIEGSEAELFGGRKQEWIVHTSSIAIELHSEECERLFLEAINGQSFNISRSGETLFCTRAEAEES